MPQNMKNTHDALAFQLKTKFINQLQTQPSVITKLTFANLAQLMNHLKFLNTIDTKPEAEIKLVQHEIEQQLGHHLNSQLQGYQPVVYLDTVNEYQLLINDYTQKINQVVTNAYQEDPYEFITPKTMLENQKIFLKFSQEPISIFDTMNYNEMTQNLAQEAHYLSHQLIAKLNHGW